MEAIGEAAKRTGSVVVIGYSERLGKHLYMGQTVFGADGRPVIVRSKIRPSGSERLIFSDRPVKENTKVVNTSLGRVGRWNAGSTSIPS